MAFTKVVGAGIHTLSNITSHNINSSGIITATKFVGPFDGGGGINAGIVTCTTLDVNGNGDVSGNFVIDGNLTVNGTTSTIDTNLIGVDRVEVGANSNSIVGVAITQSGTADILNLFDGGTKVVTVDDEGNVGLASAIPSKKLDVVGDTLLQGQTTIAHTTSPQLIIKDSDTNSPGDYNGISFRAANNTEYGFIGSPDVGGHTFFIKTVNTVNPIRLQVNSSTRLEVGNVGVYVSSTPFYVNGGNSANFSGDVNIADSIIHQGDTDTKIRFPANGTVTVETDGSERFRIDSSGRVRIGLGSTTEGTVDSDDLTIATTGNTGMTIRSGATSNGAIHFSHATSGVEEYAGFIDYDHNTDLFTMGTNSSRFLSADSDLVVTLGKPSFGGPSRTIIYGNAGGIRKNSLLVLNATASVTGRGAGVAVGGNTDPFGSFYGQKNGNADSAGGDVFLESIGDINFTAGGDMTTFSPPTPQLLIKSDGKVGIGTDTIYSKLQVQDGGIGLRGAATPNINFSPTDGNSGNADISYDGNDLKIISNSSQADIRIGAYSKDNHIVVRPNGRIGIRTDNPVYDLDVKVDGGASAGIRAPNGNCNFFLLSATNSICRIGMTPSGVAEYKLEAGNNYFRIRYNNTERLRIRSDGKVGINTSNPQQIFEVYDKLGYSSGVAPVLNIRNGYQGTVNASNALGCELRFSHKNHNSSHDFMASRIIAHTTDNYNQRTFLRFYVAKGNNGTERLTIDPDGEIGINNTTPAYPLDIRHDGGNKNQTPIIRLFQSSDGCHNAITLESSTSVDKNIGIQFKNRNAVRGGIGYIQNDKINIYTGTNAGATNGMIINASGFCGINDDDPPHLLNVKDDTNSSFPIIGIECAWTNTGGFTGGDGSTSGGYGELRLGYVANYNRSIRGSYNLGLSFFTNNQEALRLNNSGNVLQMFRPASTLRLRGYGSNNMEIRGTGSNNNLQIVANANQENVSDADIVFISSKNGGSDVEKMRITATGLIQAKTLAGSYYPIASINDGSSSARAATSAWEIKKTLGPRARNGYYYLKNPYDGTVNTWWCDMTTDGGGWILIAHTGEGTMSDQGTGGDHWFSRNNKGGFNSIGSGYYTGGGYWRTSGGAWSANTCGQLMWDVRTHQSYYDNYANSKVVFNWGTDQAIPSGSSGYSNIPGASNRNFHAWCYEVVGAPGYNPSNYHQNTRNNTINGANYFTEHMVMTWSFRNTGGGDDDGENGPYWMIGAHANGLHQHYEESLSGDSTGNGKYQVVSNEKAGGWGGGGDNSGYPRLARISDNGTCNVWLR